jgi:DNA repair exonuclease SbcCD ATPase subunit
LHAGDSEVSVGEVVAWITAALSAVASVLAWAARLVWGREFAAAKDETIKAKEAQLVTKDETIKAKDAQIEGLTQRLKEERELNPMTIREYFVSVKAQLEEYIAVLKGQRDEAHGKLGGLQKEIEAVQATAAGRQDQIQKLLDERETLRHVTATLSQRVDQLQAKREENDQVLFKYDSLLAPITLETSAWTDMSRISSLYEPLTSLQDKWTLPFQTIEQISQPLRRSSIGRKTERPTAPTLEPRTTPAPEIAPKEPPDGPDIPLDSNQAKPDSAS